MPSGLVKLGLRSALQEPMVVRGPKSTCVEAYGGGASQAPGCKGRDVRQAAEPGL